MIECAGSPKIPISASVARPVEPTQMMEFLIRKFQSRKPASPRPACGAPALTKPRITVSAARTISSRVLKTSSIGSKVNERDCGHSTFGSILTLINRRPRSRSSVALLPVAVTSMRTLPRNHELPPSRRSLILPSVIRLATTALRHVPTTLSMSQNIAPDNAIATSFLTVSASAPLPATKGIAPLRSPVASAPTAPAHLVFPDACVGASKKNPGAVSRAGRQTALKMAASIAARSWSLAKRYLLQGFHIARSAATSMP